MKTLLIINSPLDIPTEILKEFVETVAPDVNSLTSDAPDKVLEDIEKGQIQPNAIIFTSQQIGRVDAKVFAHDLGKIAPHIPVAIVTSAGGMGKEIEKMKLPSRVRVFGKPIPLELMEEIMAFLFPS